MRVRGAFCESGYPRSSSLSSMPMGILTSEAQKLDGDTEFTKAPRATCSRSTTKDGRRPGGASFLRAR